MKDITIENVLNSFEVYSNDDLKLINIIEKETDILNNDCEPEEIEKLSKLGLDHTIKQNKKFIDEYNYKQKLQDIFGKNKVFELSQIEKLLSTLNLVEFNIKDYNGHISPNIARHIDKNEKQFQTYNEVFNFKNNEYKLKIITTNENKHISNNTKHEAALFLKLSKDYYILITTWGEKLPLKNRIGVKYNHYIKNYFIKTLSTALLCALFINKFNFISEKKSLLYFTLEYGTFPLIIVFLCYSYIVFDPKFDND